MTPKEFYERFAIQRALSGVDGCLMRDDRVRPWSDDDEIALAELELARGATVH